MESKSLKVRASLALMVVMTWSSAADSTPASVSTNEPESMQSQTDEPAQNETAELPDLPARHVHASLAPGVWLPRLRGDAGFGVRGSDLRFFGLDTDLSLGDSEPSFSGDAGLAIDRWRVRMSAFDFSSEGSATLPRALAFGDFSVPGGSTLHSSIDIASFAVDAGYEIWRPLDRDGVSISIAPTVSARYLEIDHAMETDLPVSPARTSVSTEEIGILGGARVELNVKDTIFIRSGGGFGANVGGGTVWQIDVDATWLVHPNFGLTVGYRVLDAVVEDDDYEFSGQLAGLFVGGSLRF